LSSSTGSKAIVVTYPDEFAKNEILELARAAGYDVAGVMTVSYTHLTLPTICSV